MGKGSYASVQRAIDRCDCGTSKVFILDLMLLWTPPPEALQELLLHT